MSPEKPLQQDSVYLARWILPMDRPPIKNAFLRVRQGCVVDMGARTQSDSHAGAIDLGDIALLPRLVNAHTHLEFSDLREPVGKPGMPLAQWIGEVVRSRDGANEERSEAIRRGLNESKGFGVGLVADIATPPSHYPDVDPLTCISFAEVLGLSEERGNERLESAGNHRDALRGCLTTRFGVSPHAPYSTPIGLIKKSVELADRFDAPLAMHVAESPDERQLLNSGTGPFRESLVRAGLWRDGLFPWATEDPIGLLVDILAKSPRALLVHGNDLRDQEIEKVANHGHLSVVYCPRTHDYFGYDRHPVGKLIQAGVRVALGTDSKASNPDLNLWGEVRYLLQRRQDLDPIRVLEMATICGADALLGAGSGFGIIRQGETAADCIVGVRTTAESLSQLWRDLVDQESLYIRPLFRS